jgi:hypothetical protein
LQTATASLKASGFARRQTLAELASKGRFHWSNWGQPGQQDMNTVLFSTGRAGWDWGVKAGCLILTRARVVGNAPVPTTGPFATFMAGRIVDHWALTFETGANLTFQLVVKLQVTPDTCIMVSAYDYKSTHMH